MASCSSKSAATQHYAAHWAAKEAVLKALATDWRRGIRWRDIEIRHHTGEAPTIVLCGGARDLLDRSGIRKMYISMSHCRSHATAYAIAEGDRG